MTNQEQPDTRPRCGGSPGKPGLIWNISIGTAPTDCPGCADCAPAPDTQSGGRPTVEEAAMRYAESSDFLIEFNISGNLIETFTAGADFSRAALQEARDEAAYWHGKAMEYANRATAAAGERDRTEAAEAENATLRAEVKRVRALIDLDRTGLALGLSEVRHIVRGHEWLADPEGGRGSYTDDEWDEAAIRREVNDLITGVDEAALKALTESGYRADAAYREPLTDADVARLGLVGIAAGLREQISAQDRELSALSTDKQTLMTATTHWRERAEQAEARMERLRNAAMAASLSWNESAYIDDGLLADLSDACVAAAPGTPNSAGTDGGVR